MSGDIKKRKERSHICMKSEQKTENYSLPNMKLISLICQRTRKYLPLNGNKHKFA